MTRIKNWPAGVGRPVQGSYRVLAVRPARATDASVQQTVIRIADATGEADCLINEPDHVVRSEVGAGVPVVRFDGVIVDTSDSKQLLASDLTRLDGTPQPEWSLIPLAWVPENGRPAFARLQGLLDGLNDSALRAFVGSVFADERISEPFMCVPGSRAHHHAYDGGLLIHSVQVAETTAAAAALHSTPARECELAVVGALFHDIGKIRLYARSTVGMSPLQGTDPEALNLEVLAPALACLDTHWGEGAAALRSILAPARSYTHAPYLMTDLVRAMDRLSAGQDLRERAFQDAEGWQRYTSTDRGQLLARLTPKSVVSPQDWVGAII